MALIVEDGSGKAGADSWVSLADADAYWAARNQQTWLAATDPQQEAALRNAADYMLLVYRWPGQPSSIDQRLPWPRSGVPSGSSTFPTDAIPSQVIAAQQLLAIEDLVSPLLQKATATPQVVEEERGLKGLTKRTRYSTAEVEPLTELRRFPMVDATLAGIALAAVNPSIGVVQLVRGL